MKMGKNAVFVSAGTQRIVPEGSETVAKKNMKRPEWKRPKNQEKPVPEIQGKAKQSGKKANPPPGPYEMEE